MFSMDVEGDTLWLILIFVGVVIISVILLGLAYATIRRKCTKKADADPASLGKDKNSHKVITTPTILKVPNVEYEVVETVTDNMSTRKDQNSHKVITTSTIPKIPNVEYDVVETVTDNMSTTSSILTERDREIMRSYGVQSIDDSEYIC